MSVVITAVNARVFVLAERSDHASLANSLRRTVVSEYRRSRKWRGVYPVLMNVSLPGRLVCASFVSEDGSTCGR